MKKINIVKLSLFTLILAFIAIGTIAVAKVMNKEKTVEVEQVMATETWYFNGATNPANNDPLDASQYSQTPSHECDSEVETICTILAPAKDNNTGEPNLKHPVDGTETVEDQIEEALQSGSINDTVTAFRSN